MMENYKPERRYDLDWLRIVGIIFVFFLHCISIFSRSGWFVVNADNKKRARLNCISHLLSMIEYKDIKPKPVKLPPRQKRAGYVRPPIEDQNFIPEKF